MRILKIVDCTTCTTDYTHSISIFSKTTLNKISFYYYGIKSLNHTSFVSNKKLANFTSI